MANTRVFVVRNQHDQYLNKQNEWVDGRERQALFRTPYKDAAINQLFEATMKDIGMRGEVVACGTDAKGDPLTNTAAAPAEEMAELAVGDTENVEVIGAPE